MLRDALKYLDLGWSIIPLKPKDKTPLLSAWKEFQSRKASVQEVTEWFASQPHANLGLVTGKISDLVVVDLELDGLNEASRLKLSSNVLSITGKGRHLYYKYPGELTSNAASINGIKGFDFRADGGYVVLPPSVHPGGKKYTWLRAPYAGFVLPALPNLSLVGESKNPTTTSPDWMEEALNSLKKGNRHTTFISLIGKLHRENWSVDSISTLLVPHAEKVNFSVAELKEIIQRITTKYAAKANEPDSRQSCTIRTFSNSFGDYKLRKQSTKERIEYPTGFTKFDRITGGLRRQEILTVAARTGTGKTNWLISVAKHLCSQNKSVLFFSTEMAYDTIWDRYISAGQSPEDLQSHDFFVCDDFTPDLTRIENTLREIQPDVFIFDHINHVGEEHLELAKFMQGLKLLARKFNCPGIVSAQLNRLADWVDQKTGQRVIPRLSMLKGSGTIEQVSAQVLLLSETEVQPDQNCIIGSIDKNRYGDREIVDFVLRKNPLQMVEQN